MAKISTYPVASPPSLSSMLIGTDVVDNSFTKNFTISDILGLIDLSAYVPYTGATSSVDLGSNGIIAQTVDITGSLLLNGDPGIGGYVATSNDTLAPPSWEKIENVFTSWRGSFYHTLNQVHSSINSGKPVVIASEDLDATNGVSVLTDELSNLSRIAPNEPGVYNVMFSAQLAKSSGGDGTVDFWLRKGSISNPGAGTDVTNTNGTIFIQGNNSYVMAVWNYFIKINPEEYVQLVWAVSDTSIEMIQEPANAVHPATPSVIITINKV
jgi:hypothetical protein